MPDRQTRVILAPRPSYRVAEIVRQILGAVWLLEQ